jgi:hypothetical protein
METIYLPYVPSALERQQEKLRQEAECLAKKEEVPQKPLQTNLFLNIFCSFFQHELVVGLGPLVLIELAEFCFISERNGRPVFMGLTVAAYFAVLFLFGVILSPKEESDSGNRKPFNHDCLIGSVRFEGNIFDDKPSSSTLPSIGVNQKADVVSRKSNLLIK